MKLERKFFFAYARLLASMDAKETNSQDTQIRGKVGIWGAKCRPQVLSISMIILVLKESGKTALKKLSATAGIDSIVISFSQLKYLLSVKPQFQRLV